MKLFKGSKINTIRSFALLLIFIGLIIMYGGIFFRTSIVISSIFMILGCLSIILSTIIYLWIGLLSTQIIQITCPTCSRNTKMLGKSDICMFCNQPLAHDNSLMINK